MHDVVGELWDKELKEIAKSIDEKVVAELGELAEKRTALLDRKPALLGNVGERAIGFGEAVHALQSNEEIVLKYDENGEPVMIKPSDLDRLLGFKASRKKAHGSKPDPKKTARRKQAKASRKANRRK